MNILDFEYVYNGGGVAIADFNNDGLQDVFFSGNQVSNQLYLNKGDLEFNDITEKAGINGQGKWSSGVAVVDINNDGLMDIYVGATVNKVARLRENMLYINQGVQEDGLPVFKDLAKEYGVADDGHTTTAAFFDYDNDGDLDLYVVTNTIENYPNTYRKKVLDGSSPTTDRLYRNDWNEQLKHPVFTNVSKEAGIVAEGYGLGINITDINRDGWQDIYVTNDYITNDLLYINNGNGTFTDKAATYFKHTSNSAMGNDIGDINNDGLVDVVVVDMLPEDNYRKKVLMGANNYHGYINNDTYKYTYEYVRNTLQLNQGNKPGTNEPIFSEISLLANMAQTDWSWSPLIVDFDHDGNRDLVVTNGFPKDVTDRDFISFRAQSSSVASKEYILSQIPEVKIKNYAFRNNGDLTFTKVTDEWGFTQPSFSNGAAFGDLDNDGDLDYVVNNINDQAFVYRNNLVEKNLPNSNYLRIVFKGAEKNKMGLGVLVELELPNGQKQVYEHTIYRGYLSSIENAAHFGLGSNPVVKKINIVWPGGKKQLLENIQANQTLTVDIKNASSSKEPVLAAETILTEVTDSLHVTYVHQEPDYIDFNVQKLLPHKLSQYAPALAVGDVNGDGLTDVFTGGSRQHQGVFFMQNSKGNFEQKELLPAIKQDLKEQEDMGTLLFDADGDNDLDLYIASGGSEKEGNNQAYQDRLYINDGKGNFSLAQEALPPFTISSSCVKAADFDKDGDLDLFVGGRVEPDKYPKPVTSYILRNDSKPGEPKFTDLTTQVASTLTSIGLVCDALWTDYDNDGWIDLLLAGEWMPLTLLKNNGGKLENVSSQAGLASHTGWWNSLLSGDFDNDGDTDYIAGNLGLNSLNKASDEYPVTVYAKDFDNNGSFDAIPTTFFPDNTGALNEYTFHGREDLIKQMISMRARFPYYKDFANASLDKLLSADEKKDALILKANYLSTCYLENTGKGNFIIKALPVQAQVAPVFGMIATDIDNDSNLDVLLVGNDFGNEVMMGRYDAFNGLILKNNGKAEFKPLPLQESGFFIPGNAKALAQFTTKDGHQMIIASQNRGRLCLFKNKQSTEIIKLQPNDAFAWITYADGHKKKEEFYYGHSFLSQSARELMLPENVKEVEIYTYQGNKRTLPLQ
ncbi:VCBS repeat-containing protein [Rhodocytophaga aerolata]